MTQGELEQIPQAVVRQISELEIRIMTDIVRRIKANGFSTASADWQLTRLQQLGESEANIKRWIQEALQVTDDELNRIYDDTVYKEYYGHERAYRVNGMDQIPFDQNQELQQIIESVRRQTQETFGNLTGSMGFALRNPETGRLYYTPLLDYYESTLDAAMWDIHSGAFDYQTVLTRTITQMTNSGLRWIDYESGWHNRVDVAARRAVMTGFRQIQGKINAQVAEQLHTDQYETTAHVGARPTHQPWQGRVWTMQQLIDVCGLGDVVGLHGANCYHDYRAFPPGSIRTYTDDQLDAMMERENTPKEYNGKQYTTYEALQQQRKMETAMRATRQQIKLLQEGGASKQEIILKKAKYQGQMQTYKAFSKAMDLPEQMKRVYQDGLGSLSERTRKMSSSLIEWPRGGTKISPLAYKDLMKYAKDKGIELSGFKQFKGDPNIIKQVVDDANEIAVQFPEVRVGPRRLTVELDSLMSADDFAITNGHIVRLNGNAFANPEMLSKQYQKMVDEGWFVKGTTYRSIIKHEMGHVVADRYKINILDIAKQVSGMQSTLKLFKYLEENLSQYAVSYSDGREIIAECFSSAYGSELKNVFALKFIEKCVNMNLDKGGGLHDDQ